MVLWHCKDKYIHNTSICFYDVRCIVLVFEDKTGIEDFKILSIGILVWCNWLSYILWYSWTDQRIEQTFISSSHYADRTIQHSLGCN